jgi:hypothetical protein
MKFLGEEREMDEEDIPRIDMSTSSYPIVADRLQKDANLVS